MTKKTLEELNEELVCSHLSCVTENETAWILLQEPGFIGFGVVQADKICWPPDIQPDWTRISDLRLFGEAGEWHVWSHWNGGWQSRWLRTEDIADALTEYHALWGTDVELGTPWVKLKEDRGTEIQLPLVELKKHDLPLRLKLKQIIDYDDKSGLAGITDAALVALVSNGGERVWHPPTSLS